MEAGRLLTYIIFIVIPLVAMIVYILLAGQFTSKCKTEIGGTKFSILGSLSNCIEACWSKHNFGQDIYSDDCFLLTINSSDKITKNDIESYFDSNTKVYFNFLEAGKEYKIKVRYNSTGKEISLILFEISK